MSDKKIASFGYYVFSFTVVFVVTLLVIRAITPFGSATTPDSIHYLDISYNYSEYGQIGETDFSLERIGDNSVVPQRIWPPGYPVILSTLISDPFDVVSASRLSNFLLFTTSALILILLRIGNVNWLATLVFSVSSLITLPLVLVYSYAWSETLFIPILLGIMVLAFGYLGAMESPFWKRLLIILVFSVLAIFLALTRYIGILMFLLFPVLFVLGKRTFGNFAIILSGIALYVVTVGVWLWGNYTLTGNISGSNRAPSDFGVIDNFNHAIAAFLTILPASYAGFIVAGCASVGVLCLFLVSGYSWADKVQSTIRLKFVIILCATFFIYLFGLVAMRSYSQFDQIDVRLIAPAIPLLIVMLAMVPALLSERKIVSSVLVFVCLFGLFSLVARGYDRLNAATINWMQDGMPHLPMRGQTVFNNFTRSSVTPSEQERFRSLVGPGARLVVDRPLIWRFRTRLETIQKPSQFHDEQLSLLNSLPEGSALVLAKNEVSSIESAINRHGWTLNRLYDGRRVVVQLPFHSQ